MNRQGKSFIIWSTHLSLKIERHLVDLIVNGVKNSSFSCHPQDRISDKLILKARSTLFSKTLAHRIIS